MMLTRLPENGGTLCWQVASNRSHLPGVRTCSSSLPMCKALSLFSAAVKTHDTELLRSWCRGSGLAFSVQARYGTLKPVGLSSAKECASFNKSGELSVAEVTRGPRLVQAPIVNERAGFPCDCTLVRPAARGILASSNSSQCCRDSFATLSTGIRCNSCRHAFSSSTLVSKGVGVRIVSSHVVVA
eukprot:6469826-Amphidinium_carterae.3